MSPNQCMLLFSDTVLFVSYSESHLDLEDETLPHMNYKDVGIPSKGTGKSRYVEEVLTEFKDKDIVDRGLAAPLLVTPGGTCIHTYIMCPVLFLSLEACPQNTF